MSRFLIGATPPPSPPPPIVVTGGTPPRSFRSSHITDETCMGMNGTPPILVSSLADSHFRSIHHSPSSPSALSAVAAAHSSPGSAPCPAALLPTRFSRSLLSGGNLMETEVCRSDRSSPPPPPYPIAEPVRSPFSTSPTSAGTRTAFPRRVASSDNLGGPLVALQDVQGHTSPLGAAVEGSARRLVLTGSSSPTTTTTTTTAGSSVALPAHPHSPLSAQGDSTMRLASSVNTTHTTNATSHTGDSHTGGSDSRTRGRPPRLALRLFDQPDELDSSLDHSRAADTSASFPPSLPARRAGAVQSALFGAAGGDDKLHALFPSPPSPPPFAADLVHRRADDENDDANDKKDTRRSRSDGLPTAASTGRRGSAHYHARAHDDQEQAEGELAELLFLQTPLSPCASFTAPQFSVMTSRSSTSHFSPTTSHAHASTTFERANSLNLGRSSRGTHAAVSSRTIVERHLRRQQQQQQQQPPLSSSQMGSVPHHMHPNISARAVDSTSGSFTFSHRSAQSGSPLMWSVSRALSPQSPAPIIAGTTATTATTTPTTTPTARVTGVSPLFPATVCVPDTPLQAWRVLDSLPTSGRKTRLTGSAPGTNAVSTATTPTSRTPPPERPHQPGAVASSLCSSARYRHGTGEEDEEEEDVEEEEEEMDEAYDTAGASQSAAAYLTQRRNTLEPAASASTSVSARPSVTGVEAAHSPPSAPLLSFVSPSALAPMSPSSRSMPWGDATLSDASPPSAQPPHSQSPTHQARTMAARRAAKTQAGAAQTSTQGSHTSTQESSPHFSASASYAALTLGKLMTPDERERSPQPLDAISSFSSFPLRSGTATPTRARLERAALQALPRAVSPPYQRRGAHLCGPLALATGRHSSTEVSRPTTTRTASSGDSAASAVRLSPGSEAGHLVLSQEPVPLTPVQRAHISGVDLVSATTTATATWDCGTRSPTVVATPPHSSMPLEGRAAPVPSTADPSAGQDVSLDDLTIRSHNTALSDALHTVRQDMDGPARVDGIQLPHVLHAVLPPAVEGVSSSLGVVPPTVHHMICRRRHSCQSRQPPVLDDDKGGSTTDATPATAPATLLPLFGQLSAKGCRSYQEDSVLMLPDICVHLTAPLATEAAGTVPALLTGVPDISDSQAPELALPSLTDATTKNFSCFGVFDGHNGDQVSTRAQQYFLDHFEVSYQHYYTEACRQAAGGDDEQRTLSAALVQTLLHLDVTIYDQLRNSKAEAGSTACVMACTLPDLSDGAVTDEPDVDTEDGIRGVDYLDVAIANLGDSRAVVGNVASGGMILQTVDHRVRTYPTEEDRIKRCGGIVEFDRVEGCYDVTRGLGDYHLKCSPTTWWSTPSSPPPAPSSSDAASSSSPSVGSGRPGSSLTSNGHVTGNISGNVIGNIADVYEVRVGTGDFVLIASDGVWDRVSSEEAVTFVADALQPFFEACSLASTAVMDGVDDGAAVTVSDPSALSKVPVTSAASLLVDVDRPVGFKEFDSSSQPSAMALDGRATDSGPSYGGGVRGMTTSSGGLTSEGPLRSPTTPSLPTTCQLNEPITSTPLEVRDTEDSAAPSTTTTTTNTAEETGTSHSPSGHRQTAADGETEDEMDGQHTPKSIVPHTTASDAGRSPSARIPSPSDARRRPAAAAGQAASTPGPTTRARRFRRLSNVDLVQRAALPSDVLERRAQQQQQQQQQQQAQQSPQVLCSNTSDLPGTPLSYGTPTSSTRRHPASVSETSEGPLSGTPFSPTSVRGMEGVSPPSRRAAAGAGVGMAMTATGSETPHRPDTAASSTRSSDRRTPERGARAEWPKSKAAVSEFHTPSRPSDAKDTMDAFSTASLAQMVRKVSAALADYALLERNSSDNVTVVLVVFAPSSSTTTCPLFSASITGYQSP